MCLCLFSLLFSFQICFVMPLFWARPRASCRACNKICSSSDTSFLGICAPFGAPVPSSSAAVTMVEVKFSKPTVSSRARLWYLLCSSILKLDESSGCHLAHLCFGTCLSTPELFALSKLLKMSAEKSNFVPTMKWSVPMMSMKSRSMKNSKACDYV